MVAKALCFFIAILCVICADESGRVSRQAAVCGSTARSTGTIVHGGSFRRGDYPWIVALLYTGDSPPSYFCGGTLVSSKHVITAAHCIKPKYGTAFFEQLYPNEVLALFGAFNLTNFYEPERVALSPEEFIVHKEWNTQVERFDADIAVLKFAGIFFSRFIQPVCLSLSSQYVANEANGIVAGWGMNENESQSYQPVPKLVKLPIHSNEQCFFETPVLASISSGRTFCAGVKDGSGVCLGDSGSGFFVILSGVAHLRGIVSSSRTTPTTCDVTAYAVYTDVLKYRDWLTKIIDGNVQRKPQPVTVRRPQSVPTRTAIPESATFRTTFVESVTIAVPPPTTAPIIQPAPIVTDFACGVPEYKPTSRSKRIVSPIGVVGRGRLPWLSAIYFYDAAKWEFLCAATLISQKVVVTAGTCIASYRDQIESLVLYAGKSDLENLNEIGTDWSAVSEIIIHPDLKFQVENRDADIAALVLSKNIVPAKFIHPICLWPSTTSYADLIGSRGVVAGWGVTDPETKATSLKQPQFTEVGIVTQETCHRSNPYLAKGTSKRTFCAKDEAGLSGPCTGDSGGGLFVQSGEKWFFRGILSANLVDADGNCDIKSFAVYTDIAQFGDWLREIIRKHG